MVISTERISHLKAAIGDYDDDTTIIERLEDLRLLVESFGTRFDSEMARLSTVLGGLAVEVAELKRMVASQPSSSTTRARDVGPPTSRVYIVEPITFSGVRIVKELENYKNASSVGLARAQPAGPAPKGAPRLLKCFLCRGLYRMGDCPRGDTFAAIIEREAG